MFFFVFFPRFLIKQIAEGRDALPLAAKTRSRRQDDDLCDLAQIFFGRFGHVFVSFCLVKDPGMNKLYRQHRDIIDLLLQDASSLTMLENKKHLKTQY